MPQPDSQPIQLFVSPDGQARLEVALQQETVWLSQAQMAQLFDSLCRSRFSGDLLLEISTKARG